MACRCHTALNLPHPCTDAKFDFTKLILDAVKKYEIIPDRREMIHDPMFKHMLTLYKKFHVSDPDSFTTSMCEWMFLGRYTGFRREEWCNEKSHEYTIIDDPLWVGNKTRSVAIEDFRFFDHNNAPVTITPDMWKNPQATLPRNIAFMELCFRKQKNNDNHQKIIYSRSTKCEHLCPVYLAFRIHCRGRRLGAPLTYPAAIYWDQKSCSHKLLTSRQANQFLRQVASKTFDIPAGHKSLEKWSCHSIRVTACNLLHRAGFSDSYIKMRLRWRSKSFEMYLRNTFYSAGDHTSALALPVHPTAAERRTLEPHEELMHKATQA